MTEIVQMLDSEGRSALVEGLGDGAFVVRSEGRSRSDEGMKKSGEAWLEMPGHRFSRWALRSDESELIGGENSAPPPLVYFAAGIMFCLMTQIERCAKMKKVALGDVQCEQDIQFFRTGSILAGTILSTATTMTLRIEVDSAEPAEKIAEVVRLAQAACYAHGSLTVPVEVKMELSVNGEAYDDTTVDSG